MSEGLGHTFFGFKSFLFGAINHERFLNTVQVGDKTYIWMHGQVKSVRIFQEVLDSFIS